MPRLQVTGFGSATSWGDVIADSRTVGEMAEAVAYFRRVLGDQWQGWRSEPFTWDFHAHRKKRAQLAEVFDLSFQGGPREWVRLYRLIQALDGVAHVEALVRSDLGSSEWTEFLAATMTLEFCGRLRPLGHAIELIETADLKKPPDARIILAKRPVVVEFKALHEHAEMAPWDDLWAWANQQLPLVIPELYYLEIEPSERALEQPVAFFEGLRALKRSGVADFQDLPLGTGRARIIDRRDSLWRYPVHARPELQRIAGKTAGDWWKKFREAKGPTLLVVRTGMLFGENHEHALAKAEEAALELARVLAARDMISAIVIYDEILWSPRQAAFFERPNFRLNIAPIDGCDRAALLVLNSRANVPLGAQEIDALVSPAMHW